MTSQASKIVSLFLLLCMCVLGACKDEKPQTVLELFSESRALSQNKEFTINEDSLARIDDLVLDGENLIVYDCHSSNSYTLFDASSGEYIAPFGRIGQGPTEIPLGCYGYSLRGYFSAFSDQSGIVMKYSLDSVRSGKVNGSPVRLTKYKIPDAQISRLIAIDDSTFLGAGTYQSRYQYFLFDKNNRVLDCGVDVYNVTDSAFNAYTKFMANQGVLIMHPDKKAFAYSVNFSSNIDFFEIVNNKIKLTKSLRLGDPICEPKVEKIGGSTYFSVSRTEDSQVGYVSLSATAKYVYALYSDKNLNKNGWKSNVVLVFDWDGNPVAKYTLDADAYSIAVDEVRQNLFAAVKNSEGGWSIVCYAI